MAEDQQPDSQEENQENQNNPAEEPKPAEAAPEETSEEETPEEEKEYSEEEIKQMREKSKKYWEENLPSLRLQEEYERLTADIEEHRARRLLNINRQAQMVAPPAQGPPGSEQPTRKLKED